MHEKSLHDHEVKESETILPEQPERIISENESTSKANSSSKVPYQFQFSNVVVLNKESLEDIDQVDDPKEALVRMKISLVSVIERDDEAELEKLLEKRDLLLLDFSDVICKFDGVTYDNLFSVAAVHGGVKCFEWLLKTSKEVFPSRTCLFIACKLGHAKICELILDHCQWDAYERFYALYQGTRLPLLLKEIFALSQDFKKLLNVPLIVEDPPNFKKNKFTVHLLEGKNLSVGNSLPSKFFDLQTYPRNFLTLQYFLDPCVKLGFFRKGKPKQSFMETWDTQPKKVASKTQRKTSSPKWNEKFTITCPQATILVEESNSFVYGHWSIELVLQIWDKHRLKKSTLLDEVRFDIDEINRAIATRAIVEKRVFSIPNSTASLVVQFTLEN